jgi:hypothetical protein
MNIRKLKMVSSFAGLSIKVIKKPKTISISFL